MIAVDIGNSRIKLGRFPAAAAGPLPEPDDVCDLAPEDDLDRIARWLKPDVPAQFDWWIASVNRPVLARLLAWLERRPQSPRVTVVAAGNLPLSVDVPHPAKVGIDRLLGALAANRIRSPDRPALVVDLGSAITVDLISAAGVFLGGAILPGIGMSARALHQFTDLLPQLDMVTLEEPPPPLGKNTTAAIQSGLYWGAVGGVRELISRLSADQPGLPQVYLTGGAAPAVASLLASDAQYLPHLVLSGIVLAAAEATA